MKNKKADTLEAAVTAVKDGDTVLVGGFGAAGVPEKLIDGVCDRGLRDLTIVTNSLAVASHFFYQGSANVRVLGGRLQPVYQATFGPEAVAAIKEHFFDLAIIAISAVHAQRGFMDYGEDEAIMRRAARAQAKRSVIVADSSKFGRLGSIHTFGLGDLDAVITAAPLAAEFADQFRQLKVDVIYA